MKVIKMIPSIQHIDLDLRLSNERESYFSRMEKAFIIKRLWL